MGRRAVIVVLAVALITSGLIWGRGGPALAPAERQLVGTWTTPEFDPRASYVTSKGPVTNPVRVWELRPDRSFRVGIASADDPTISVPLKEGLWSAEPGKIRLEGFGRVGDAWREIRERIRLTLSGSYLGRTSGTVSHPIRFLDGDAWELIRPEGQSIVWRRRP